jgi:hypothetical protein
MFKQKVLRKTDLLLSFDMTDRIEEDAWNNSSIVARVFVAAVTFLPSYCLATKGGSTYIHTD